MKLSIAGQLHVCPNFVVSCFSALPLGVGGGLLSLIVALHGELFNVFVLFLETRSTVTIGSSFL